MASDYGKTAGDGEESYIAPEPLTSDQLRRHCDTSSWDEDKQAGGERPHLLIGQERAAEAIEFACSVARPGFNLYVLSPPESGNLKHVSMFLRELGDKMPTPPDWVYVHNFDEPREPTALKLKPGRAPEFQNAMKRIVEKLLIDIPAAFESDDYIERAEDIDREANHRIQAIQERAAAENMTIININDDFRVVPLKDGEPMDQEDIERLPYGERRRIEEIAEDLQDELDEVVANLSTWQRRSQAAREELEREVGLKVIDRHLIPVAKEFAGDKKMNTYLAAVRRDILCNIELFASGGEEDLTPIEKLTGGSRSRLSRFDVNCFVTQSDRVGAPVRVESNPVYGELVGSLRTGTAIDRPDYDFVALHPGAFHKAAGGYLVLSIDELLTFPLGWDVVKRTLRTGQIQIDTPNQWFADYDTESLDPEPIPFDGKVILIGDRYLHYRLSKLDPEFAELFKVLADFAEDMPRDKITERQFGEILKNEAEFEGMLPMSHKALGRLVEFASRHAEDSRKVSLFMQPLIDLMAEAEHIARASGRSQVDQGDVKSAELARVRRLDLMRERAHEYISEELIKVETTGTQIGQVNGLVVTGLEHRFGRPCRISARVRMGEADRPVIEQVVDIQSQSELSGSSHSKGVMVLSGYLQSKFSPRQPLALSATLVFEQSHNFVDGDSASCAELCALLSAIAKVPLKQNMAITGAVSQYGDVQVIGGVNEKIEGFFDVCQAKGLTGDQGVIIPHKNVEDLMLRDDVVAACKAGKFRIYPVATIDRAIEVLTGMKAGKPKKGGTYPAGTLFYEVERRLAQFEEDRRRALRPWPTKSAGK